MSANKKPDVKKIVLTFAGDDIPIGNAEDPIPQEQTEPEQTPPKQTAPVTQSQNTAGDGRKNNQPPKKQQRYTVPISLRITEDQKNGLNRLANREQTDTADIIRRAINAYLQSQR